MSKRDLLSECNDQKVPLQDFQRQFCVRCQQPECTRSRTGSSLFEDRVNHWYERLFSEVPRMDPADERFPSLSGQRFVEVRADRPYEVQGWVDPLRPEEAASPEPDESVPDTFREEPVIETAPTSPPEPEPSVEELPPSPPPEPEPSVEESPPSPPAPLTQELGNTPTQAGIMVGGREAPKPKPQTDPWSIPKKPVSNANVVQPGARIRFS